MLIGEILDGTFNIYRRHFGLFMRLSLLLICAPAVLFVFFMVRFATNPIAAANWIQTHVFSLVLMGLVGLLVYTTISLLLKAGTIRIISDSYLGQEPTLSSALQFGMGRIIPLLVVAISKTLLIFVIYMAAILAGIVVVGLGKVLGAAIGVLLMIAYVVGAIWFMAWVLCGYGLTSMVVVLEDLDSSFDAFGRSWELTRAARMKVFLTCLVIFLFTALLPWFVVFGVGQVLGPTSPLQPFLSVLSVAMGVVLAPILPCALTLLYYDSRVRREAFDLQILSQQLGAR